MEDGSIDSEIGIRANDIQKSKPNEDIQLRKHLNKKAGTCCSFSDSKLMSQLRK